MLSTFTYRFVAHFHKGAFRHSISSAFLPNTGHFRGCRVRHGPRHVHSKYCTNSFLKGKFLSCSLNVLGLSGFLVSLAQFLGNIVAVFIVEKFGRRFLLVILKNTLLTCICEFHCSLFRHSIQGNIHRHHGRIFVLPRHLLLHKGEPDCSLPRQRNSARTVRAASNKCSNLLSTGFTVNIMYFRTGNSAPKPLRISGGSRSSAWSYTRSDLHWVKKTELPHSLLTNRNLVCSN